mmetsp:Transcript_7327/g.21230  ORF Transcript_7327/g.21230 Transcript_7327/m.21230 type:complete len:335 (-) Transcript_7327:541-1545(-)
MELRVQHFVRFGGLETAQPFFDLTRVRVASRVPPGHFTVVVQLLELPQNFLPVYHSPSHFVHLVVVFHLPAPVEAARGARHNLHKVVGHLLLLDPPDDVLDVPEAVSQGKVQDDAAIFALQTDFLKVLVSDHFQRQRLVWLEHCLASQPPDALPEDELQVASRRPEVRELRLLCARTLQDVVEGQGGAGLLGKGFHLQQIVKLSRGQHAVQVCEFPRLQVLPQRLQLLVEARGDEAVVDRPGVHAQLGRQELLCQTSQRGYCAPRLAHVGQDDLPVRLLGVQDPARALRRQEWEGKPLPDPPPPAGVLVPELLQGRQEGHVAPCVVLEDEVRSQ